MSEIRSIPSKPTFGAKDIRHSPPYLVQLGVKVLTATVATILLLYLMVHIVLAVKLSLERSPKLVELLLAFIQHFKLVVPI